MDTLGFARALVIDLEAGERAEDYIWSVVALAADDAEWLSVEDSEAFLQEMVAG